MVNVHTCSVTHTPTTRTSLNREAFCQSQGCGGVLSLSLASSDHKMYNHKLTLLRGMAGDHVPTRFKICSVVHTQIYIIHLRIKCALPVTWFPIITIHNVLGCWSIWCNLSNLFYNLSCYWQDISSVNYDVVFVIHRVIYLLVRMCTFAELVSQSFQL